MRIPRIYTPQALPADLNQSSAQASTHASVLVLEGSAANHVGRVLRMTPGRELKVFNGESQGHYQGIITDVTKKTVTVNLTEFIATENESPLSIHLGQAISKGDRMDFTIQKSVELGVNVITPLWTQRCDVKLNGDRLEKKLQHWQQVAISACEQSGRDRVPTIAAPLKLEQWVESIQSDERWVLDPRGKRDDSKPTDINSAALLVGPEGGLTEEEILVAAEKGFKAKLIGPRVLRTETAALTAITLMQSQWGDFL